MYNIPLGGGLFKAPWAIAGSGSTYCYAYCDATFREGWSREETVDFVRNSAFPAFLPILWSRPLCSAADPPSPAGPALALAMSRDGSSGGTIRMAIITKEGVERVFVPGDQLPRFYDKA